MKRNEAIDAFEKLAAAYPNWKVDEGIARVWIEEMETVEAETVNANVRDHIRSGSKFPPSLPEILQKNPRIEADKEKVRTREYLEQERNRAKEIAPPPWVREGISREEWMERVISQNRGKQ